MSKRSSPNSQETCLVLPQWNHLVLSVIPRFFWPCNIRLWVAVAGSLFCWREISVASLSGSSSGSLIKPRGWTWPKYFFSKTFPYFTLPFFIVVDHRRGPTDSRFYVVCLYFQILPLNKGVVPMWRLSFIVFLWSHSPEQQWRTSISVRTSRLVLIQVTLLSRVAFCNSDFVRETMHNPYGRSMIALLESDFRGRENRSSADQCLSLGKCDIRFHKRGSG